jgi:uncharacterized protein Usg
MARGELAINHATFDRHPSPRTAMHLRELFIRHGLLEPRDRFLDRFLVLFQHWLDRKLAAVSDLEHRRLLQLFATWHHLRQLRAQATNGTLHNGPVHTAKQEVTEVMALLADIEAALATYEPRPHWGKLFVCSDEDLARRFPRLPDFLELTRTYDPTGKFPNAFIESRCVSCDLVCSPTSLTARSGCRVSE